MAVVLAAAASISRDGPNGRRAWNVRPEGVTSEALYWEVVARYKATKNSAALAETARALAIRFAGATWTKKASVWAPA